MSWSQDEQIALDKYTSVYLAEHVHDRGPFSNRVYMGVTWLGMHIYLRDGRQYFVDAGTLEGLHKEHVAVDHFVHMSVPFYPDAHQISTSAASSVSSPASPCDLPMTAPVLSAVPHFT